MTPTKDIIKVIRLVKKECGKYKTPVVTEVGVQTKNPFHVLISCILSLRTKDAVTAKASKQLFALAQTPEQMRKLRTQQIERAIYPVGFYKTKARTIKDVCTTLIEEYNSKVPTTQEALLSLKGVGLKTCNIVLSYGHKQSVIAVDTHCHRIPNRLGWVKTKTPDETQRALTKIIPRSHWMDFNNTFVTFGQNVCTPISPWCSRCPVNTDCKRIGVTKSR